MPAIAGREEASQGKEVDLTIAELIKKLPKIRCPQHTEGMILTKLLPASHSLLFSLGLHVHIVVPLIFYFRFMLFILS